MRDKYSNYWDVDPFPDKEWTHEEYVNYRDQYEQRKMYEKVRSDPISELRHDIKKAFDGIENDFERQIVRLKNDMQNKLMEKEVEVTSLKVLVEGLGREVGELRKEVEVLSINPEAW